MEFSQLQMESISGEDVDFAQFDGQYALCVNLASK